MKELFNIVDLSVSSKPLEYLVGFFILIILLRELFLRQARSKPLIYYAFLFPGVVIHELSHALVCLITFTKIKSIKFFSKTGGFVLHDQPRFMLIGFLISIAPLIAGVLLVYLALVNYKLGSTAELLSAQSAIVLYFLASILLGMLPSRQDILNSITAFIVLTGAAFYYLYMLDNLDFLRSVNQLLLFSLLLLALINIFMLTVNIFWRNNRSSK